MNVYERKQADRRERMLERADRIRKKAAADFRKADLREEVSGIPLGQPILVGHHSERKHRNAMERADNAMRRGIEASRYADDLERRATTENHAISSDDPDADDKLAARIAGLEAQQTFMREANKIVRAAIKAGVTGPDSGEAWTRYVARLREHAPTFSEKAAAELLAPDFAGRTGFPSYALSNNNANINRLKARLATIEAKSEAETTEKIIGDVRVIEDADDNRLRLIFPVKPDEATRAELKARGFRWSPSAGAWQRQLNNGARWAAECVLKNIGAA